MEENDKMQEKMEDAKELLNLMKMLNNKEKTTVKDIITGMVIMKEMYDASA